MALKTTQKDSISANTKHTINPTFSYGVIYVYSIPGEQHKGRLKVGSATVSSLHPTQDDIESAAHQRIKQQTKTADIRYVLEYATLALTDNNEYLSDHVVHDVLKRSGFDRSPENAGNPHSEWFKIDLATAISAIRAAKEGRLALLNTEKNTENIITFDFRPNQIDAIVKTKAAIKKGRKHYLWNAKMRFGKTSTAMQVAKESNMQKVLIVTHRPSVSEDWYSDFNVVFSGTNYEYSSKTKGEGLEKRLVDNKPFVYFASMQDLRLSEAVVSDGMSGSKSKGFKKNQGIFDTTWDMLIIDEAHEGTTSSLGDATITKIPTNFTLELSGTPFNILHKREEDEVYTWDYVMEQYEKAHWDENYPGVPNPYAELPSLSMFTYDIDKYASHIGDLDGFSDSLDGAFKFHEFFRVHKDDDGNDTAQFIHEDMVNKFLDLLANDKLATHFPYATEEYRSYNKHSLWLLPNRTKVIEAMEKLLKSHPVFEKFGIVNISGNAKDDDSNDTDAKQRVTSSIKNNEYTITLTGQRLTTGASIPEWTAVFMLSDTNSATTYLQTAFRCQTPAKIDGKLKTQGYIFDFAPDRTLKLVAEAIELNHKSGKTNSPEQKEAMANFLNFCPIIAAEGGSMKPYDVSTMLVQLKKAIIERVSRNGFDDPKLYNDELLQLNEVELNSFNDLKAIVGTNTADRTNELTINELGMGKLETEKAEAAERKKKQKKQLTDEEKEFFKKLKEARDQKKSAISILRAVSIRMPMLVYGADVSIREDITLNRFIDLVDSESWMEFMPVGLTKEKFREFIKYYDEEVFRGVAHSIRAKAFDCDELLPTDRIQAIAEIFGTFKNPDKETVLTPWNVVNMQICMTLGGNNFRTIVSKSSKPEWIGHGEITQLWSQDDAKILEINSKSGLYPLLAAYNIYSRQLIKHNKPEDKIYRQLWNKVLSSNIYVLCKSPMAATITRRTLAGYTGAHANIVYVKDLVKKLRQEDEYKGYNINKELQDKFGIVGDEMKFTAIVGNPPYNEKISSSDANRALSRQLFPQFIQHSINLNPKYMSLITPSRWFAGEAQDGSFPRLREFVKKNNHFVKIVHYPKASDVFPGIIIKGGVSYFLWERNYQGNVEFTNVINGDSISISRPLFEQGLDVILDENESIAIHKKVSRDNFTPLTTITQGRNAFGIVGKKSVLEKITEPDNFKGAVEVRCMNKEMRYADRKYVTRNTDILDSWKVFISKSSGDPVSDRKIIGTPYVGAPNTACTDTFIPIGRFTSESEARNLATYLKTRFLRYMVSVLKVSQNVSQNVYQFVPIQDFSGKSDIDWSHSIDDIDGQLYDKYDLTKEEITFIETRIKAAD